MCITEPYTKAAAESKIDRRAVYGAQLNSGRIIFHSDLNNFYASVECALNPALRGHPVAVCGSSENRHGIVLAKNNLAKKYGVKTAEVIWQAKQKCPGLVLVEADYGRYEKYSHRAREIYCDYTDRVEPFGSDEAWLDITGDPKVKTLEQGRLLADEIRSRIFGELGLTVSIGVSYNKIFAKLASDYKKPDATTVFAPEDYGGIIANLPASDMIFVGKSTQTVLARYGIHTLGELARMSPAFMKSVFGKSGASILCNARGENTSPVAVFGETEELKSIGNSTTPPRDLVNNEDARALLYMLAESVGTRLRRHRLKCTVLQISVRESDLSTHEHQTRLEYPTNSTSDIAEAACRIFTSVYSWHTPVRSLGIRGCGLVDADTPVQLSLLDDTDLHRERQEILDRTVDSIRSHFGRCSVQRGIVMCDSKLTGAAIKGKKR